MCLNGGLLGVRTLPSACDPVLLYLTLHAIPPPTLILIRNAWFQEDADILRPGSITIVFMARLFFIGESSF